MAHNKDNKYKDLDNSSRLKELWYGTAIIACLTTTAAKALFFPDFSILPDKLLNAFSAITTPAATPAQPVVFPATIQEAKPAVAETPSAPQAAIDEKKMQPLRLLDPAAEEKERKDWHNRAKNSFRLAVHSGFWKKLDRISKLIGAPLDRSAMLTELESSMGRNAQQNKSTAKGVGQIVEGTFLDMIGRFGKQFLALVDSGKLPLKSKEDLEAVATLRRVGPFIKFVAGKTQLDDKGYLALCKHEVEKKQKLLMAKHATANKGKKGKQKGQSFKLLELPPPPPLRDLALSLRKNETISLYFTFVDQSRNKQELLEYINNLDNDDPRLFLISKYGDGFLDYSTHLWGPGLTKDMLIANPDKPMLKLTTEKALGDNGFRKPEKTTVMDVLYPLARKCSYLQEGFNVCMTAPPKPAQAPNNVAHPAKPLKVAAVEPAKSSPEKKPDKAPKGATPPAKAVKVAIAEPVRTKLEKKPATTLIKETSQPKPPQNGNAQLALRNVKIPGLHR